jgi:hypothetical protein
VLKKAGAEKRPALKKAGVEKRQGPASDLE